MFLLAYTQQPILFFTYSSGNRTPGSRFYSDLLHTPVCIHQLVLKCRLKHQAAHISKPCRPKRRQNIITALTTLPQGWVLAQRRTANMAVWSEPLWALCKSCTGNKCQRERSSNGDQWDDKSTCISTIKVSFSPIIIRWCHCMIAITTVQSESLSGFHTGFFCRGERLCAGKLISCGHRPQPPGGSGGMLPQKNFEILSPLRVIFKPSESDLRPSTDQDTRYLKKITFQAMILGGETSVVLVNYN